MSKAITTLKVKGVSCPVEDAATKAELAITNNQLANTNAELASTKEELSSTKTSLANTAQELTEFKESTTDAINKIESGDSIVNKAYNDENGHNLADTLELATETKTAFESFKTSTEDALDTKLTKVTRTHSIAGLIYGVMNDGSQTTFNLTTPATAYTIPYRLSDGSINVGTPTTDNNATTKKYVDDKLTRTALIEVIGKATTSLDGIMSKEDKVHLDTLVSLMEDDDNAVVDKIHEIIAIFNQYPEGIEIATTLSNLRTDLDALSSEKLDVSTYNTKIAQLENADITNSTAISNLESSYNTKVAELEEADSNLESKFDELTEGVGELETRVGNLESDIETKANASNVYTTSEVYTKTETDAKVKVVTDSVSDLSGKVTTNTTDISNLQSSFSEFQTTYTENKTATDKAIDDNSKLIQELDSGKQDSFTVDSTLSLTDSVLSVSKTITDELANKADKTSIPTKTSQLTNDSGFAYTSDIPTKISDLEDDSDFVTSSFVTDELAAYTPLETFNTKIASKQDKLTAGKNITISGNSISSSPTITIQGSAPTLDTNNYRNAKIYMRDNKLSFITENYDTNSYVLIDTSRVLPVYIDGMAVASIGDYIYIIGGRCTRTYGTESAGYFANKTIYRYNILSMSIEPVYQNCPFTLENGDAVAIGDFIYIFAANNLSTDQNEIWRFNPFNNELILMSSVDVQLYNVCVTSVMDNYIHFIAGRTLYVFNTSNGTIGTLTELINDYSGGAAVGVIIGSNKYIYAFGNTTGGEMCYAMITIGSDNPGVQNMTEEILLNKPSYRFYSAYNIDNKYVYFIGGEFNSSAPTSDYMPTSRFVIGNSTFESSSYQIPYFNDSRGVVYKSNNYSYILCVGGSNRTSAINEINVFGPEVSYKEETIPSISVSVNSDNTIDLIIN